MVRFLEVKNTEEGKKSSRIAIDDISDYREFVTDDDSPRTIIFLKGGNKKGKVVEVDVKVIDEIVGVKCIG
jgi:hypothetical protein